MNDAGPTGSKMALVQASIVPGSAPSHVDDPYDWTTDQVIHYVCSPNGPLSGSQAHVRLSDDDGFARILRDEDIHGEALLTLVTTNMLHDAWGLKYGACAKVLNWIRRLQQRSYKYQEMRREIIANEQSLRESDSRTINSGITLAQSPAWGTTHLHSPWSTRNDSHFPAEQALEQQHIDPPTVIEANGVHQITSISDGPPSEACRSGESDITLSTAQAHKETIVIDGKGRPRRHLTLAPVNVADASGSSDQVLLTKENSSLETLCAERSGSQGVNLDAEASISEPSQAKAQSLDPVNLDMQSDNHVESPSKTALPNIANVGGAVGKERKRIQPTLLDQYGDSVIEEVSTSGNARQLEGPTTGRQENTVLLDRSSLGKRAQRASGQIYYGPSAFRIDDVFYPGTALGDVLQAEEDGSTREQQELCFNSLGQKSDAQRSWVNSKMKFFYRSTTSDLEVLEGEREIAIIPYSSRFGRKNRHLSMTLFSKRADGIVVQRVDRSIWASTTASRRNATTRNSSDLFNARDSFMTVDQSGSNWDNLLKWNNLGDDEVLPVYGNSGSEGEYDLDTWREMEAESGKISRQEGRPKKQRMGLDEVEKEIDIAIKDLRNEWHVKILPRMRYKARRYWTKARRYDTANPQAETLGERRRELEARISSLRKEMCEEEWTKASQIHQQCKVIQPSVFEQEECRWRIAILQSQQAPDKSCAPGVKRRKIRSNMPLLQEGEENVNSDASTTADEATDTGLDDFILDDESVGGDDQLMDLEDDTIMADIEDALDSDTIAVPLSESLSPNTIAKKSCEILPKSEAQPCLKPIEATNIIDLTQNSSTPPSPASKPGLARIATPPVMNSQEDSEDWFQRSRGKKATFKHPPNADSETLINLDTDSDCQASTKPSAEMPPFKDVKMIRALDATQLVEKQDRKRLLIWLIAHTHTKKRDQIIAFLPSLDMATCRVRVMSGLKKMKAGKHALPNKQQALFDCILQMSAWYVAWTIPVKLDHQGVNVAHIKTTLDNDEGFEAFYDFMLECLKRYKQSLITTPKRQKATLPTNVDRTDHSDSSLSTDQPQNSKSRRVLATESQETRQKRDTALQRMREDNQRVLLRAQKKARQMELLSRVSSASSIQAQRLEDSKVILNPGKLDEQDFIKLNGGFSRGVQLKPHQKEGLRFMWREITGDHLDLQGCLLAHTMGTGKTLQVIALLVALSDAANSDKKNIRAQVPTELHRSQTLILCPPALIENWWDEFLLWPPEPNHLGEIRKVNAVMGLGERINEILTWSREGGVLIMGYHTFKDLLPNEAKIMKANDTDALSSLSKEQRQSITIALLEKPNLVIADEAHMFKNLKSQISQAINRVKSRSRIAMTGSPLSNKLEEYFAMIDWIAHGYLGSHADFKSVYADPITNGLGQHQKPAMYRESRKRLKALEMELEPKIHRAEASALHNSLNGKSEFIIRVPLTTFQTRLYRDFVSIVEAMSNGIDGGSRQGNLLSCLSMLQLLCNHPGMYYKRLSEECNKVQPGLLGDKNCPDKAKKRKRSDDITSDEKNTGGPNISPSEDSEPLPDTIRSVALREAQKAADELGQVFDSLELSNKLQLLMKILELSSIVGDKALVFSRRLDTLDYIGALLKDHKRSFSRIDGKTQAHKRQAVTKSFNEGTDTICLVSTTAGGQGLNMTAANRVIIMDSDFNPMWEQQAVGRAYRLGQKKHVYVYRLNVAGTFEEDMQNQALFKEQLAARVLEKTNPKRVGSLSANKYIYPPKEVENDVIDSFFGKDTAVLDYLLANQEKHPIVSITPSESFYLDDGHDLTAQERMEAEQLLKDEQLRRRNPGQYQAMLQQRFRQPVYGTPLTDQLLPQATSFGTPLSANLSHAAAPAQSINTHAQDVETRLLSSISALFRSGALNASDKADVPETTRSEARSAILALVLRKPVPHPDATARRLCDLIGQYAKNGIEYLYSRRGVERLLEMPDVHPDVLLRIMLVHLGSTPHPQFRGQTEQSAAFDQVTASSSKAGSNTQIMTTPAFPQGSIPQGSIPLARPASALAMSPTTSQHFQSENTKRASSETNSDRLAKKGRLNSMITPNFASVGAMETQFDRLLASERWRK